MEGEPEPYESLSEQYHTAMVAARALEQQIHNLSQERDRYLRTAHHIVYLAREAGYDSV